MQLKLWGKENLNNFSQAFLRTVPTFVTAHTFCASRDTRVFCGLWVVPMIQAGDIFARFIAMRRKQNLASAFGIQEENWA